MSYIQEFSLQHYNQIENDIMEKFAPEKTFLFVDFLREDVRNDEGVIEIEAERIYEAIDNLEFLRKRCYQHLEDYNNKYSSKQMPLVLFDDAIRHLLRISRIIRMKRSSGLLVGVGGSGK
jgi:dynein heavy chain